jgi:hypothetical protein
MIISQIFCGKKTNALPTGRPGGAGAVQRKAPAPAKVGNGAVVGALAIG